MNTRFPELVSWICSITDGGPFFDVIFCNNQLISLLNRKRDHTETKVVYVRKTICIPPANWLSRSFFNIFSNASVKKILIQIHGWQVTDRHKQLWRIDPAFWSKSNTTLSIKVSGQIRPSFYWNVLVIFDKRVREIYAHAIRLYFYGLFATSSNFYYSRNISRWV